MKVLTLISMPAAVLLISPVFATPYDVLAEKGYRWVTTNGPYACGSKVDLRESVRRHTDLTEVQMIQQPGAYYLIEEAIEDHEAAKSLQSLPLRTLDPL